MIVDYDKVASQSCSIIEVSDLEFSFNFDDLHSLIKKNALEYDMGALKTDWSIDHEYFKEIDSKFRKVVLSLPSKSYTNKTSSNPKFNNLTSHCNNDYSLETISVWGQLYGKGSFQTSHSHLPSHWSFVLFVNCPEGSSPVIFGDDDIKVYPKQGHGVVFPAWIRHYVPKNLASGRSVVSGNFYYSK